MIFPLAGNLKIKDAVLGAISSGKIPHAIIIEGDEGLGKHTLANFIALASVCGSTDGPCLKCNNCHLAQINSHPDINVISAADGKKNIAVAQIREMRAGAFVKPHQAKRKVHIIDGADTMNEQSQNALLKVLEEPPGEMVFILIAESKTRLLETIISRCVLFSLSEPEKSEAVRYIAESYTGYSKEQITEVLENSGFNIGRALCELEGDTDEIRESVYAFLNAAIEIDEWEMICITNDYAKDRISASRFVAELKTAISTKIKSSLKNSSLSRDLFEFYNEVSLAEGSLITNINLSLFFTSIISKASEIFGG